MAAWWLDLVLAAIPFAFVTVISWRIVWPRWKLYGKAMFYFSATALLSWTIGHYSVLVMWLHQALGLVFHIAFCRRHGFTWYAVEDPERYVELSKQLLLERKSGQK